jgi:cell division protein YceG involved in septum cleavage
VPDSDWTDPFADDPAAAERERRRAEREARRRERQQSLGEKVKQGGGEPAPAPPAEDEALSATPRAAGREAGEPPAPAPDPFVAPEQPARKPPRAAPGGRGMPSRVLIARRLLAATVLIAAAVGLVLGISALLDRLGGTETKPQPVAEVKVRELVIPEGLDRRQIAELTKKKLKGDYAEASKNFKGFKLGKYGAGGAPSLEGFLFPATYELPRKATAKDLIERQLAAFEDNLAGIDMSYAKSRNLNTYDVLKIASMIEREIQVPEERRLAAAVIYNRLKAGTPLGIDATIRYEDQNYDEQILASRLDQETPYNTRIITGLPPTPIGNPGLASIEAAAKPAKSDAFFFVVKPGTCGEHVFVETQEEFDQAEAEYQAALQEQGGSPTEC